VRRALDIPVYRKPKYNFQRIRWRTGTKRNYGMLCFLSTETHALPQMFVLSSPPHEPPISDDARRSYVNTSSTLSKPRSKHTGCPHSPSYLRVYARFGWFWECPNGGEKCQYRHALPPGFVLKSQRKAIEEAEKANTISLEEFLEVEVRIESFPLHSVASDTESTR